MNICVSTRDNIYEPITIYGFEVNKSKLEEFRDLYTKMETDMNFVYCIEYACSMFEFFEKDIQSYVVFGKIITNEDFLKAPEIVKSFNENMDYKQLLEKEIFFPPRLWSLIMLFDEEIRLEREGYITDSESDNDSEY